MLTLSEPTPFSNGRVTWREGQGIALITLTNPPANGYSHEMMRDLDEAILRFRFDPALHVLIVAGEGERFFCAGADIEMLHEADPAFKYMFCLHANETLLRLEHTPKLTIAALGGHCVGGGLEVALACDLRVARKASGRCGLPEVKLGVLPGTGGTQRLARALGKAKSIELMATGELMNFDQAETMGLINRQMEADDEAAFLQQVCEWALTMIPPKGAGMSVGLMKRAVQSGIDLPLEAGLALERELQARLFASEDAKEGIAAFVEKRPPQFKGR
jgi:enoyl-CoA hydratase/carnithine racemase